MAHLVHIKLLQHFNGVTYVSSINSSVHIKQSDVLLRLPFKTNSPYLIFDI